MICILLINLVYSLSWKCDYSNINGPVTTHFLYKEDNVAEVKWLERIEYCRAKGDSSVYRDAGQGKCEYSRGLCYWDSGNCLNTNRQNDPLNECLDLLNYNTLVEGLDNGRLQQPSQQPQQQPTQQPEEQQQSEEQPTQQPDEFEEPCETQEAEEQIQILQESEETQIQQQESEKPCETQQSEEPSQAFFSNSVSSSLKTNFGFCSFSIFSIFLIYCL